MDTTMSDYFDDRVEEDVAIHILSVSAAMVGVCLTVVGIIRLVMGQRNVGTLTDDFLALDSLLFLSACLLAYAAIRSGSKRKRHRLERVADVFFILALLLMVVVCVLITYAVI